MLLDGEAIAELMIERGIGVVKQPVHLYEVAPEFFNFGDRDQSDVMAKGWVYVTSNTELPGLVKVGFSTKVPSVRAEELTSTGLPEPHVVEYEVLVENAYDVEQEVHRRLADVHYKKEFFRCHPSVAVAAIRAVVGGAVLYESAPPKTLEEAERERQRQINESDPWFQRRKLMSNWVICEDCGKQYEKTTGHPCPVRNPSLR